MMKRLLILIMLVSATLNVAHAQFAYVANSFDTSVSAYTVHTSTGALVPLGGSPFAAGSRPSSVAVDLIGKFAYVANSNDDTVSGYTIHPTTGALTPMAGSPFSSGGTGLFAVTVDPTGKFVYVGHFTSSNVSAFTIHATTGVLTPIGGSPFASGGLGPFGVTADPTGKFLYVANQSSWNVSAFTIHSTTGALTPVAGSPFATGSTPRSVAVDPTGKFAYVTNTGSSTVSGYTIHPTTGALTPMAGSPFSSGWPHPQSVTVDPTGRFAYVANSGTIFQGSSRVVGFSIHPANGELTPLSGSPSFAGNFGGARIVTVDPTGEFLYVTNRVNNAVFGFTIHPTTGLLTSITGQPFVAGLGPDGIAITGCTTPPSITDVSADPAELWPANHKMKDVVVNYSVAAPCGEPPVCTLTVASNEPIQGTDDGNTSPDWEIVDEGLVSLRAERSGIGTGRIYTVTIACSDTRGNMAQVDTVVTVPLNQK